MPEELVVDKTNELTDKMGANLIADLIYEECRRVGNDVGDMREPSFVPDDVCKQITVVETEGENIVLLTLISGKTLHITVSTV